MKTTLLAILALASFTASACARQPSITVSIVPENSQASSASLSWADDCKRPFYIVITNHTAIPHAIFESWNSWGYQNISFEVTLPGKPTQTVTVKPQRFTRNFPSTYTIPPSGHQVLPITFNDKWQGKPDFGKKGRTKVKLKAIYQVQDVDEAKKQSVWLGPVISETIEIEVNHW